MSCKLTAGPVHSSIHLNMPETLCRANGPDGLVSSDLFDSTSMALDLSLRSATLSDSRGSDGPSSEVDCGPSDTADYQNQLSGCWYTTPKWNLSDRLNCTTTGSVPSVLTIPSPDELLARTRAQKPITGEYSFPKDTERFASRVASSAQFEVFPPTPHPSPSIPLPMPSQQQLYPNLMLDPLFPSFLNSFPVEMMPMSCNTPLREIRANYIPSGLSTAYPTRMVDSNQSRIKVGDDQVKGEHSDNSISPTDGTSKPRQYRKARAYFQPQHMRYLEAFFQKSPYLSTKDRELLSKQLNLTEDRIRTWFQNRRMREKRNPERFRRHGLKSENDATSSSHY